jgi:DNA uptake protein ComE-like DNA-binding protein
VKPFVRVEDIMEVRGIGPKTFERFHSMITVRRSR